MRNLSHTVIRPFVHNLLWLPLTVLLSCSTPDKTSYDLVISGTNIHTLDTAQSTGSIAWIGIKDGRIAALGTRDDALPEANLVLQANEDHVYPGFIDAHGHLFGYAESLHTVNLFGTSSVEECIERIEAFIAANPEKEWIIGRGWDQNDWPGKAYPSAKDLDRFSQKKLFLTRIDGHAAWVNTNVMKAFTIEEGMRISGGSVLDGILIDQAESLVQLPSRDNSFWRIALLQTQDSLAKYGITAMTDAGLHYEQILLLDSLITEGKWLIPINAMISNTEEDLAYFEKNGPIEKPLLRVKSVKAYLDGALGSRGALLRAPYHDLPQHYGLPLLSPLELNRLRDRCLNNGWQLCVHAIGDSAHHVLLESFNELDRTEDLRFRVEHAQIMTPEDSAYYHHPNIIPSVQPTHATSDMYWAAERLGEHRLHHSYSYKRILNASGLIALGTDFPIEHIDPLATFFSATTRKDRSQWPEAGFIPEQALSPLETLRGMTVEASYAAFTEHHYGAIAIGQLANFTIVNQDLLSRIPVQQGDTKVVRTIVQGRVIYP